MQRVHLRLWKFGCQHRMKQMDARIFGNLLWYNNLQTIMRRYNPVQAIYALEDRGSTISLDSAELVLRVRILSFLLFWSNISISWQYGRLSMIWNYNTHLKRQGTVMELVRYYYRGRQFSLSNSNFETNSSCAARIFKKKRWSATWWKMQRRIAFSRIPWCMNHE